MLIDRPNPHLHQPLRQSRLHDPRKRTCMRQPVPLELVIQIRMRIKMKYRQLRIPPRHRLHDWIGNRMIPAQRHRPLPRIDQRAHSCLNRRECILLRKRQIPRIRVDSGHTQVRLPTPSTSSTHRSASPPEFSPEPLPPRANKKSTHQTESPAELASRVSSCLTLKHGCLNRVSCQKRHFPSFLQHLPLREIWHAVQSS